MKRAIWRTGLLCALGSVVIPAAPPGISPAGAQEFGAFEASAKAEGFRFVLEAPAYLAVETFADWGGPIAQAKLDGLGTSQSFASMPYPSDNAISGPGLVAAVTGLPSPPAYPFYAESSYPTRETSTASGPGINLKASSTQSASEAAATGGHDAKPSLGASASYAATRRDQATGEVKADATTGTRLLDIGGVLKLGECSSKAAVVQPAGQPATKTSDFRCVGVSIAGQEVGLSNKGFTMLGNGQPIPAGDPILGPLRQARIDVRYLTAAEDDHGVTSPGLVITQEIPVPEGPRLVFRYILGRASARAS